ncbi:hypothetical protein KIK06_17110 [Nocardiopsis sp. EMB25]|uniref:hypothetical protein n=1 Tax=Nocardiopsis sp. EMB25 TaxID=2835867 RepID=UPI0022853A35|nr:hypothetical protein [Nocardiopsis sp. EMB25]MCY9785608.1 hypothetical protein [Nocardiopsis sp. EMB25]
MLTTTPLRAALRRAAALLTTTAAATAAVACGAGHGHTPEELDAMIADRVRDSASSEPSALPDTVFDPDTYMCSPAVDSPTTDTWRTETPRSAVSPGAPARLGVLAGEDTEVTRVTVAVLSPDGSSSSADVVLSPGAWSHVDYPEDFTATATTDEPDPAIGSEEGRTDGVHTVIWSDGDSGTPLTCDGFSVG